MKCLIVLLSLAHLALGSKQFSIPDMKTNWHEAHKLCTNQGMQLASVHSQQDHEALVNYVKLSNKLFTDRFWIGANDLAEQGRLPLNFTKWDHQVPNNKHENCVEVNIAARFMFWNDANCPNKNYFVCETVPPKENPKNGESNNSSWLHPSCLLLVVLVIESFV